MKAEPSRTIAQKVATKLQRVLQLYESNLYSHSTNGLFQPQQRTLVICGCISLLSLRQVVVNFQ